MTYLFISDLHLSADHPRLVRGFLDLLTHYQQSNTKLYILGDWFNAWIGDDYTAPWLDEIVAHLKHFTDLGNEIYFSVGNRDFALSQTFLSKFNGRLLTEISTLNINDVRVRIEHGDALCTDDISYQRFKKIIRNPLLLRVLRKLPLSLRAKIATGFRKKSKASKEFKSFYVMDVNTDAVNAALNSVDVLIHGHTHRPEIHQQHEKYRIVLGDWRLDQAQILVIDSDHFGLNQLQELKLHTWNY